jgi:hypothetical protein
MPKSPATAKENNIAALQEAINNLSAKQGKKDKKGKKDEKEREKRTSPTGD